MLRLVHHCLVCLPHPASLMFHVACKIQLLKMWGLITEQVFKKLATCSCQIHECLFIWESALLVHFALKECPSAFDEMYVQVCKIDFSWCCWIEISEAFLHLQIWFLLLLQAFQLLVLVCSRSSPFRQESPCYVS